MIDPDLIARLDQMATAGPWHPEVNSYFTAVVDAQGAAIGAFRGPQAEADAALACVFRNNAADLGALVRTAPELADLAIENARLRALVRKLGPRAGRTLDPADVTLLAELRSGQA